MTRWLGTWGDISRKHQRNALFGSGRLVTGPGATHAGLNSELSLCYGTFPQKPRPKRWRRLLFGAHVREWCEMSGAEFTTLHWPRFAIILRKH